MSIAFALDRRTRLVGILAAALAGFTLLRWWLGVGSWALHWATNVAWTLASLLAGLRCLAAGCRAAARNDRRAWQMLGAACLVWFGGMLVWNLLEYLGDETPYVAASDIGFVGSSVLFAAGMLWYRAEGHRPGLGLSRLCNFGLILCSVLICVPLVLHERGTFMAPSWTQVAVALSYPVTYISATLFGVICLWTSEWGEKRRVFLILLGGIAANALVEIPYAHDLLQGTYFVGKGYDVCWLASFALIYWAASEQDRLSLAPATRAAASEKLFYSEAAVPAGGMLLIAGSIFFFHEAARELRWLIGPLAIVFALLVGGREWANLHTEAALRRKMQKARRRAAEARMQLEDAIEALPEGIALYDADDRLVLWNQRLMDYFGPLAAQLRPGATFEALVRSAIASGQAVGVPVDSEAWIADRLAAHRNGGSREEPLASGRWLRTEERRTRSGGVVGVRVDITELKQREASFRLLFESNPVPMWLFDKDTWRFLEVNEAAVRSYGYSRQQFLTMTIDRIRPPEELPRMLAADRTAPQRRYLDTWRHQKADGSVIEVEISAANLAFRGSEAVLVSAFDVTGRVNAQRAVNAAHDELAETLESIADAFYSVDASWRFTYVNRRCLELWGRAPHELLGRTFLDVFPAAEGTPCHTAHVDAMLLGEPRRLETRCVTSAAPIELRVYPRAGGGLAVYFAEIGDRLAAAEALRRSEEHLARAQQVASIGSFEYDVASGRLTWSDEVYRLYGLVPGTLDLTVELARSMLHPDDVGAVPSLPELADAATGPGDLPCDYRIIRADGEIRVLHRQCDVVVGAEGGSARLIGTVQDVTAARAAEEQARRLQARLTEAQKMEALGTLAGGIAHDLNNTLVPIMALGRLLADAAPIDSTEREDLEIIVGAASRAGDLVKRVLAFSRKEQPKPQKLDLRRFVEQQLALLRAATPQTIRLDAALADVPPVEADPTQLFQVVLNVVTNAAQAIGGETGLIRLTLAPHEDAWVRLSVSDSGCGMDEETAARIFEPFFTTKAPGDGTGMGLAVVHGIVSNHRGRIAVESERGSGTTVTVDLPVLAVGALPETAAAA